MFGTMKRLVQWYIWCTINGVAYFTFDTMIHLVCN